MWRFCPGVGKEDWAAADFDDSSWAEVTIPSDWRSYGLTSINATGWFRRAFNISGAQRAAAVEGRLHLALGDVAVADVTFINGVKVSGTIGKSPSWTGALSGCNVSSVSW